MAGLVKTGQEFFDNSEILNRSIAVLQSSTTWSPANKVLADVYVVGGGGTGGQATASGTNAKTVATGGAAGSVGASRLVLEQGTVYTITVGAGGSGAGDAGSASEFSGPGITTINAPGGNGGNSLAGDSTGVVTVAGATGGGVATGGNLFNVNGSTSGTAECGAGAVTQISATTGGTVPGLFTRDESLTSGSATTSGDSDLSFCASAAPSLVAPSLNVTQTGAGTTYGTAVGTVGGTRGYLGVENFTALGPYVIYSGSGNASASSTGNAGAITDAYIRGSGGTVTYNLSGTRYGIRAAMGCGGGGVARTLGGVVNAALGGNGFVAIIPIKLLEGV